MNSLQEIIDLLWSVIRGYVFQKDEENIAYLKLLTNLRAKEEILCSKIAPELCKEVIEIRLLADMIAAQDVYREVFMERIKTMVQIIEACKPIQEIRTLPTKCPLKIKIYLKTKNRSF